MLWKLVLSPSIMISHKSANRGKAQVNSVYFFRHKNIFCQGIPNMPYISRYLLSHSMAPEVSPWAFVIWLISTLLLCITCKKIIKYSHIRYLCHTTKEQIFRNYIDPWSKNLFRTYLIKWTIFQKAWISLLRLCPGSLCLKQHSF